MTHLIAFPDRYPDDRDKAPSEDRLLRQERISVRLGLSWKRKGRRYVMALLELLERMYPVSESGWREDDDMMLSGGARIVA